MSPHQGLQTTRLSLHRDRTILVGPLAGGTVDFKTNWFDALTGRLGYAFAPGWLLYGQGGVAWAHSEADLTFAGFNFGNAGRTRTGWTAGGGVEWMFARGWSAFLEGNFMDFGDNNHTVIGTTVCLAPVGCAFNTKATAATVLVGVNYRFGGWGGY